MQNNFTKFGDEAHADVRRHAADATSRTTCSGTAARRATTSTTRWQDFYTDATDFWPIRTARRRRWPALLQGALLEHSGLDKPFQPLKVMVLRRLRAGRMAPAPERDGHRGPPRSTCRTSTNTAYPNPKADALTFRDETARPVQYKTGTAARTEDAVVAAVGVNWDVRGQSADADTRRHRRVHRSAALRVDLEPARQHRRPHRRDCIDDNTHGPSRSIPNPDQATGRPTSPARRGELRAERHRSGLQVPAGLAHQPRDRPAAAVAASPARSSSSTTRTSTASTTSTPTCRRRRRRSPASTTGRAGRRTASTTRAGNSGHQRARDEEPERRQVMERLGHPVEDALPRPRR